MDQPNGTGCIICSRDLQLRACTSCGVALYCSPKCQKEDWKVHKILCATWENFKQPPAGRVDMRRVIVFEVSRPVVRFAWVPVRWIASGGESYDNPDISSVLEAREGGSLGGYSMYVRNAVRNRRMKIPLLLRLRDAALIDGSPTNSAVAKHLPPRRAMGHSALIWKGPLVVLKSQAEPERILNVDLRDFRDVADWLDQWSQGLA